MSRILALVLVLLCSGQATAALLEMFNGDRIEGEFVKVEGGNIVWASRYFGTMYIKQENVSNIVTTTPMKINGVPTPCIIEGMEAEFLVYICGGDPEERRVPLASLSVIIPYENYISGEYTYRGRLSLSGTYARGNDVRDDWKMFASTEFRRADRRHNASLEYASYSARKSSPDRMWGGRYTLDWFFRERWFLYGSLTMGGDERRGIRHYYTGGMGTGYQFWESHKSALSLTGGMMGVHEAYDIPENAGPDFEDSDTRGAWRIGMDFRYRLPLGVSLFHKNELVRAFEDTDDWQLTTGTGLSTVLADRLYSELKFDYNINNQPLQNRQRADRRLMIGVSYEW